ncbi:CAP domain-containing protein [Zobellia uliginosa]|uniref:CAP domain-containing protein n=1 Tax=Zobellia uliginosa TaxID=143224 RepID=UPI001C076CFB|nr:CAP domain-containing protein [Zobellia uliginosa]MBU2948089.1 CAP domain-containing protein [Zobellia uliginosa]
MRLINYLAPAVCCFTLFLSCSKESSTFIQEEEEELIANLDLSARDDAKKLYEDYYLASGNTANEIAWSGNVENCDPGTVPEPIREKILMRLAYYRTAVGLKNTITENATKSNKSQQAALMMHANNTLNHFPPETWNCYTSDGTEAAGNALLTSTKNSASIDSYIRDHGNENFPVGHRRWLLWPRLQEIGIGNTSGYNALWVLGNPGTTPLDAPSFIAWPPEGYLPGRLAYARWSFSIASADFSETTISMKAENGNSISLSIEELTGIYGDNTIVWQPDVNGNSITEDTTYNITIDNVLINSEPQKFQYKVTLFDPDK